MGSLIQLLDRPIAYQPSFAQLRVGKVKVGPVGAVLLSQFVYWHNRMDGAWLYKTRDQIAQETGLSRDEQETARKRLVSIGVLEEQLRGVPATMHFKINVDCLESLLLDKTQKPRQLGATPPTGRTRRSASVGGNAPNQMVGTPPTSRVEPTQQDGGNASNFLLGDYTENTQRECQADELPDDFDDPALRVLNHLNKTTGAAFQDGKTTMGFINGLLVDEYVADELILVIDHRADLWSDDVKMSQHLCPKTLFSFENFEGYLPLARKWDAEGRPSSRAPVIDCNERDAAYKRFLGQAANLILKSPLEICVRKLASNASVGGLSPEASKRTWDRLWAEQAARMQKNELTA